MKFVVLVMLIHYTGGEPDSIGAYADATKFDTYGACVGTMEDVAESLALTPEKNQVEAFKCISDTGRDMGFKILVRNFESGPS